MSTPAVSIIIPAFNASRFLDAAIASVRRQRFADSEIIIVDDGSTDDTAERAAALAPDAVLLRQPNGGPARARNRGIAHARAPQLAFLDADDQWCPGLLDALVGYARRFPDAALVSGVLDGPSRFDVDADERTPPRHRFCEIFHQRYHVPMSTVLARRSAVEEAGGFDERRELYVEDWDLWLRIAARHPVGHVPAARVRYRPGGLMSSAPERTRRGQLFTVDKLLPLCAESCARHRSDPAACLRLRVHHTEHAYGCSLLRAGDREQARQAFARALDERPLELRTRLNHAASYLGPRILERLIAVRDRFAPEPLVAARDDRPPPKRA